MVDLEGIIGVLSLSDMENNVRLAYNEIFFVISELRKVGFVNITVCNVHDRGTCLDTAIIENMNASLIQGLSSLVNEVEEFSYAIMLGFHGKRESGGRFDHTFRMDILEMYYGLQSVGEVGAFYRWLSLAGISVILVSGEGNFADEIKEFNCILHVIRKTPVKEGIIQEEYMALEYALREAIFILKEPDIINPQILEEKICITIDNPDKYYIVQEYAQFEMGPQCFTFASLNVFFSTVYNFALKLNEASQRIYFHNINFLNQIKSSRYSKKELSLLLNDYGDKDIFQINFYDRKNIADKVGIDYEDCLIYPSVL